MVARIRIKIGTIEIDYEGNEAYLNSDLFELIDKILEAKEKLPQYSEMEDHMEDQGVVGTLVSYLNSVNGNQTHNRRFLATANWLHMKGANNVKTNDVTTALKDNHQSIPSNPSDCLSQNISKGYCEKQGEGFYVTPDGKAELAKS